MMDNKYIVAFVVLLLFFSLISEALAAGPPVPTPAQVAKAELAAQKAREKFLGKVLSRSAKSPAGGPQIGGGASAEGSSVASEVVGNGNRVTISNTVGGVKGTAPVSEDILREADEVAAKAEQRSLAAQQRAAKKAKPPKTTKKAEVKAKAKGKLRGKLVKVAKFAIFWAVVVEIPTYLEIWKAEQESRYAISPPHLSRIGSSSSDVWTVNFEGNDVIPNDMLTTYVRPNSKYNIFRRKRIIEELQAKPISGIVISMSILANTWARISALKDEQLVENVYYAVWEYDDAGEINPEEDEVVYQECSIVEGSQRVICPAERLKILPEGRYRIGVFVELAPEVFSSSATMTNWTLLKNKCRYRKDTYLEEKGLPQIDYRLFYQSLVDNETLIKEKDEVVREFLEDVTMWKKFDEHWDDWGGRAYERSTNIWKGKKLYEKVGNTIWNSGLIALDVVGTAIESPFVVGATIHARHKFVSDMDEFARYNPYAYRAMLLGLPMFGEFEVEAGAAPPEEVTGYLRIVFPPPDIKAQYEADGITTGQIADAIVVTDSEGNIVASKANGNILIDPDEERFIVQNLKYGQTYNLTIDFGKSDYPVARGTITIKPKGEERDLIEGRYPG